MVGTRTSRASDLASPFDHLADVVSAIGENDFGHKLLELLGRICGGQHCSLLYLRERQPAPVVAVSHDGTGTACYFPAPTAHIHWQDDLPLIDSIRSIGNQGMSLQRFRIADVPASPQRSHLYRSLGIGERILLCGKTRKHALGLSILRTEDQGRSTAEEMAQLSAMSETLIAILDRHIEMVSARTATAPALESLVDIETTFANAPFRLPPREAQVCARILLGMTNTGIGIDLGIGMTTAMTYRKRAYQRLSISSQHELLMHYLNRGRPTEPGIALKAEDRPAALH